jgi:hypothetical protein
MGDIVEMLDTIGIAIGAIMKVSSATAWKLQLKMLTMPSADKK